MRSSGTESRRVGSAFSLARPRCVRHRRSRIWRPALVDGSATQAAAASIP